ncbi:MAG: ABC transporter substrate-binding protein [Chloroflexota bacterium]
MHYKKQIGVYQVWLVVFISVTLLLGGCVAAEPDAPQTYRVGFLSGVNTFDSSMEGFQAGMEELGYIEGETITYDFQRAEGDRAQMTTIAEQFVADEVDLIFTTTTGAAQEAKAATDESETPVVFTIVSSPVGSGVVDDLRQPGGNITGATRSLKGLISKRVAFLHEMLPDLNGVWVPHEDGYSNSPVTLEAVHEVADPRGIAVVETPIGSVEEVLAEIERLSALDTLDFGAIVISPDPTVQSEESMAALMAFAAEQNMPIVANTPGQVRNGALMTYSDDTFESGKLAATLADKVLQGTDPGTIPIAFIEPNLFLNYLTAQAIGLEIDESILAQASEVIR